MTLFPRRRRRLEAALLAALLLLTVSLTGCGKKEPGQAQGAPAPTGGAPGAGPGAPKQPPVPVAVVPAVSGAISSYYTATATLAAENEADILARVSGVVEKLSAEEGDVVGEGDVLLLLDNDEYQFRLQQAEAAREDLEGRMQRMQQMRDRDMVSAEEYEKVTNDLAGAKAAEGLAKLNLSYTSVAAPFAGRVVTRRVNVGQNVNVGTSLFVLSDFTPLLARVHVPAKEFHRLQPDQAVNLVLDSNGTALQGRIRLVSPTIDPSSGTIKVTVEIPSYPSGVRPGDFAQVSIVTETHSGVTLVPKVALVNDRGEQVVYVSAADSTAERRVVEVGFQDDANAEIQQGVALGERVVVKGQRSLKHGSAIKVLEDKNGAEAAAPPAAAETKAAP